MEYNTPEFRKWLDKLQQESWQLELLISGFAIFGLVSAIDSLQVKIAATSASDIDGFTTAWSVALICVLIFIFNLVVHVLLRGLWIGAIGLRYVSGDIDYNELNYSDKFTTYLKRKVGSFDRYISRLEDYCSILFSITFLLVFYVIGFMAVIGFLVVSVELFETLSFIPENTARIIRRVIIISFGVLCLVVFIDFIGQGFLKRKKWTSKLYFPVYWLFSKLTLSFLYRPIAYNFLDNKLGKRVSILLVPVYIAILFLSGFNYFDSNYLFMISESSESFADNANYENELNEDTHFVNFASIPSKVIHNSYLKVFIPFTKTQEDFVYEVDKNLKPEDDIRGYGTGVSVVIRDGKSSEDEETKNRNIADYLEAINQLYHLKIDSTAHISDFVLARNKKQRIGFETYLDIENLPKGKHLLTITGPEKERTKTKKDTIKFDKKLISIPFWYFPQNRAGSAN